MIAAAIVLWIRHWLRMRRAIRLKADHVRS
jgi:hypothetical protein